MKKNILMVMAITLTLANQSAFAQKDWQVQKSKNFIIFYRDQGVPLDFVNTVIEEAEDDFRTISENLGVMRYQSWGWQRPATIYIYSDTEDYVKNGAQASWSHGAALISSKTIRTYPSASGFFDSILPHELGHIILHEYIGPHAPVPLWFDEGVAMYQEKARQLGAHKAVRAALENGQFIPLTALTDMRLYKDSDQKTVQLFYMESASIVNYMITQLGESRFYQLCHALKENKDFLGALGDIYPRLEYLDDLNKMWVRFLRDNE